VTTILDDARETLSQISQDPKTPAHLRIGAVNRLLQLERLTGGETDESGPASAVLTPKERVALRDAITWGFDPSLWDQEQRAVVLRLALYTPAELDAAVEAMAPKKTRRR
jgi:hypothetical protein